MTDSPTPPADDRDPVDPDVALASAHVDGELDTAAQARLAADPDATALAVRMAAVAHAVRDVPPPPPELVDAHVAAALTAMDEPASSARAEDAVVPIHRGRASRSWWQRAPLGAVAAVAVVVAIVGAIGLASQGDDDTDTAATALEAAGDGGADTADDSAEDSAVPEAAPFDSAGGAVGDAGAARPAYDDYDQLADALSSAPTAASDDGDEEADRSAGSGATSDAATADDGAGAPPDPCGAVGVLGLDDADVEQVVPALVAGEPVTAVVHLADGGERRLSVVDDETCAVRFERAL